MTALARHTESLEGIKDVIVVKGDALNLADVQRTVEGQEAVISILGTPVPARNTLSSMEKAQVRRGIWVSAWPVAASKPWILIKFSWLMFRSHYLKLREMESLVAKSDIDWTIIRPPRLTNGERTGEVRVERGNELSSGPYSISRADLASILLDEAESPGDSRKAISVTTLPKSRKNSAAQTLSNKNQST